MSHPKHPKSLMVIASLFFVFGFITCMNDILVPHLKGAFTLNWREAALIQFAFFSAYFFVSIPSSRFCERVGYQTGMCVGLGVTAVGTFGLMRAAHFVVYAFFLISLLVMASGIALIQVAANPYVTLLGDPKTASSRLTIVQAFNSLGTTLAPLVGSTVILSTTAVASVRTPYMLMGFSFLALALLVLLYKFPPVGAHKDDGTKWSELLKNRKLALGCLAIFAYVGAEVSIGSYLIGWLNDPFVIGLSFESAGRYAALYWGGAMVGRFVGAPLLRKIEPARVLQYFAMAAGVLVMTSIAAGGLVSQWTILGVGFFNSIMFPTIFSISIHGLKRGTEKASGLLCTCIVGGALVPVMQGFAADHFGLRVSFVLPVICYAYLFYFANASRVCILVNESETVVLTAPVME